MLSYIRVAIIFCILLLPGGVQANKDNFNKDLLNLQNAWAKGVYKLEEKNKEPYFKSLNIKADKFLSLYQNRAEAWIWHGIITGTYAEATGGFKALSLAKEAKKSFENAIEINPPALNGAAYVSLGLLYDRVPGWPISFGSTKKAKYFFSIGMKMDPDGIDSNYFFGAFLINHGNKAEGIQRLKKALKAPNREGRPIADSGRRIDIQLMLSKENR